MSTEKNNQMNYLGMFDFIKGVMIFMVVLEHTLGLYGSSYVKSVALKTVFYGLITIFFIIGGYNYKPGNLKKCLEQQLKLIIKPYLVITIIITLLLILRYFITDGWQLIGFYEGKKQFFGLIMGYSVTSELFGLQVYGNGPLWFVFTYVLSWIILEIIFYIKKEWLRAVVIILATIAGFFISGIGILPFCFPQALITTFFLYAGYIIKKFRLFERKLPWYVYVVLFALTITGTIAGHIDFTKNIYRLGLLDFLCSLAYNYLQIRFGLLLNKFSNKFMNIVRTMGRYSFWIIFVHTVEFLCIKWDTLVQLFQRPLYGVPVIFILRTLFIFMGCVVWKYLGKILYQRKKRKAQNPEKDKDIVFYTGLSDKNMKTSDTMKILRVLCIVFIVNSHITSSPAYFSLNDFFPYNSFQYALLFFCIGYFYERNYENNVIKYIKLQVKRLIVPLLFWNIIYGFISVILKRLMGFNIGSDLTFDTLLFAPLTDGHQFLYNLSSWIIFPVFCVCVFNVLFHKALSFLRVRGEWICLLLYFAIGIVGIRLAAGGSNYGYWIPLVRFMFFLPCYELGFIYKQKLEKNDNIRNWLYFLCIFIVQLFIITYYRDLNYYPSWMENLIHGPFIPYITAITAIAFWLRISRMLSNVLNHSKIVDAIGNNTFNIILHQFSGFMLCKTIFAFIYKLGIGFQNFDMSSYKFDIFYFYFPKSITHFSIVYLIFGITLPILVGCISSKLFQKMKLSGSEV